jgi:phage terminase Nu1 subunit (DNA packaging protein)
VTTAETLDEVAKHFGRKPHTVGKWAKDGCPALQHPPYDVEAVKEWRAYKRHGCATKAIPDEVKAGMARRKLAAQTKKLEAEAGLHALSLAYKRRELIDARDVEEIIRKQSLALRTELLALPRALAHLLVGLDSPEKVEAKLTEEVRKSLSRLSLKHVEDKEGG